MKKQTNEKMVTVPMKPEECAQELLKTNWPEEPFIQAMHRRSKTKTVRAHEEPGHVHLQADALLNSTKAAVAHTEGLIQHRHHLV